MSDTNKGYLAAFGQALTIGLSFMFLKISLDTADPITLLAHRFAFAALAALLPVLLGKVKLNIRREDVVALLPLAIFYPTLFFLLQALGLVYLSSAEGAIIQSVAPIVAVVLAWIILKERVGDIQSVFIVATVAGVIFITAMSSAGSETFSPLGTALLFASMIASAISNVMTRVAAQKYSAYTICVILTVIGCIVFDGMAFVMLLVQGTLGTYFTVFASPSYTFGVLYLGVCSTMLTTVLTSYALGKLTTARVAAFMSLGTVISVVSGAIVLRETLHWYHLLGTAVIIAGVFGANKFTAAETKKKLDDA